VYSKPPLTTSDIENEPSSPLARQFFRKCNLLARKGSAQTFLSEESHQRGFFLIGQIYESNEKIYILIINKGPAVR
jgi:hypothetical protein